MAKKKSGRVLLAHGVFLAEDELRGVREGGLGSGRLGLVAFYGRRRPW
jgi:hypothetical protein